MAMDVHGVLDLLFEASRLKRIPRLGWLVRGIGPADAESVAEHTYGTASTALFLSELVEQPVDRGRLLAICLLHDLPETKTSDLIPSAVRYLTPEVKRAAEQSAMLDIVNHSDRHRELLQLWQEFDEASSVEARLARDADKIEMLIQASEYERSGWRGLDEFWEGLQDVHWEFPISQAVVQQLLLMRANAG